MIEDPTGVGAISAVHLFGKGGDPPASIAPRQHQASVLEASPLLFAFRSNELPLSSPIRGTAQTKACNARPASPTPYTSVSPPNRLLRPAYVLKMTTRIASTITSATMSPVLPVSRALRE